MKGQFFMKMKSYESSGVLLLTTFLIFARYSARFLGVETLVSVPVITMTPFPLRKMFKMLPISSFMGFQNDVLLLESSLVSRKGSAGDHHFENLPNSPPIKIKKIGYCKKLG